MWQGGHIMGLVRMFLALVVAISVAFPAASQDWSYGNGFSFSPRFQ
jgi:hypothetical protein